MRVRKKDSAVAVAVAVAVPTESTSSRAKSASIASMFCSKSSELRDTKDSFEVHNSKYYNQLKE